MKEVDMYISNLRGETINNEHIIKSTLNYGSYVSPHHLAKGALLHVNEWISGGKMPMKIPVIADQTMVLIPMVGSISVDADQSLYTVPLGSLFTYKSTRESSLTIKPIDAEHPSFSLLQLVFLSATRANKNMVLQDYLPITNLADKNKMLPIPMDDNLGFTLYCGAFKGKSIFNLRPFAKYAHFFAFVLDGSMEVEERILYPGDSLSLVGYSKLAIECLSGTGILLVIHC